MIAAAFDEMTFGGKHSGKWKDRSLAKGDWIDYWSGKLPSRLSDLQATEGFFLPTSRSSFLVKGTEKRDASKDNCPTGRETTKRKLPTAVPRIIWCFLAYVCCVVPSMSNTLQTDLIY